MLQKKSKYNKIKIIKVTFNRKKEKVIKNKKKITERIKQTTLLEDIIFYVIIIPLILISITIIWQRLTEPDKIPDILGYKMFVVLDGDMDQAIEYGDLIFTHNIAPENLEKSNLIAFRNNTNKVTIQKNKKITEDDIGRQFEMQNSVNEVGDTKYVKENQVEGLIIHRIPNIGIILYKIQEPYIILILIGIVLLIGIVAYYIAGRLDKRDMKKATENSY